MIWIALQFYRNLLEEKRKGKTDDVVKRWSGIRIRSPLRLLRSGATHQGQIKSDPRTWYKVKFEPKLEDHQTYKGQISSDYEKENLKAKLEDHQTYKGQISSDYEKENLKAK